MNFDIRICSSLEKIFSNGVLPESFDKLSLLKNERGNLVIAVHPEVSGEIKLNVSSPVPYKLFVEKEIYSSFPLREDAPNCTVINNAESGYYPDLLIPSDGTATVQAGKNTVFRIEFTAVTGGEFNVLFEAELNGEAQKATAEIYVSETELPEQELKHTDWFHSDCLAVYYGVDVFSEEYWRITENFIKNAAEHGVNMLLTPVFTPALDTEVGGERPTVQLVDVTKKGYNYTFGFDKLDRWVDICLKNGIKYFEISHFFTQWGAKCAPKVIADTSTGTRKIFGWENAAVSQGYLSFLRQFGKAFKEYTDKKGITDICYVHCSDEPGINDINNYRKAAKAVHEYFGAYKHIDALSDIDFYREGLIDLPVPGEQAVESFMNEVPELWTYYCCGQYENELPNRFFCFPSIKNRILGVLLYKYNCSGFLQWGFNFYFSQYSKRPVDPFKESDAGGAFPSGDSYIVYPGENGEPLPSIRELVFYDGIQDISALKALEEKTSREEVLKLIEEELGDITFTSYPLNNARFLSFADKIRKL